MANPYALDFNPLASAITDNQQMDLARNRLAMDQKRLGFEEARLGMEQEQHPLRLTGLKLQNQSAEQAVQFDKDANPYRITSLKLGNESARLGNEGAKLGNQAKSMEIEKELYGRISALGQMMENEPDPAKRDVMLKKIYDTDPRIREGVAKALPPEVRNNPIVFAQYARAVAAGYQAPQAMKVGKDEAIVNVQKNPAQPNAPATATQVFKNEGNEQFKDEHQLRGELASNPTVKNFSEIKSGYGRMLEGQSAKTGAGDLAIVYGYMKMLDPTSVVREGEFATAEKTAGVPEQVRILYNKVLSGERLSDTVRQNFLGMSDGLYKRAEADVSKVQDQYRTLAQRYKLRPENVIIDQGIATPPAQQQNLPRFNPAPRGMQDVINGRGIDKPVQERLPAPAQQTQMPRLPAGREGDAIYNSLPSGAQYVAPDGSTRTKR